MKIKIVQNYYLILLLQMSTGFAQVNYLMGPECVTYDSVYNRYLVCNYTTGTIVAVDPAGNQTIFNAQFEHALGATISDTRFYYSSGTDIRALDLASGELMTSYSLPGVQQVDGMAMDRDGNIYALASIIRVMFKIDTKTGAISRFVEEGLRRMPQDVIYDEPNHRLLVASYEAFSPIQAVSLEDGSVSDVVFTPTGDFDGIAYDGHGNYYLSHWTEPGKVLMYNSAFSNPPIELPQTFDGPSNLCVNRKDGFLAVPEFTGNKLRIIPLPESYLGARFTTSQKSGHAPLEVSFLEASYAKPEILTWSWDFDGDGISDDTSPQPTWIYTMAGRYTPSLEISNGITTDRFVFPKPIRVFNGETGLEFDGQNTLVGSGADSLLFSSPFTIEAWIYPSGWGQSQYWGGTIFSSSNFQVFISEKSFQFNKQSVVIKMLHEDGTTSFSYAPANVIQLGDWIHMAVSYAPDSSKLCLMLNGETIELSSTTHPSGLLNVESGGGTQLGSAFSQILKFDGTIDEFRIWDRVLDSLSIRSHMWKSLEGSEAGLIAYWPMNEGGGSIIHDASGNGHDLEIFEGDWIEGISFHPVTIQNWGAPAHPEDFRLQCFPNPFNPSIQIKFHTSVTGPVTVSIFDISGHLVQTLLDEFNGAGDHKFTWDTSVHGGKNIAAGIYLVAARVGDDVHFRKITLLK